MFDAKLTRRELLRLGAATGAASLASSGFLSCGRRAQRHGHLYPGI